MSNESTVLQQAISDSQALDAGVEIQPVESVEAVEAVEDGQEAIADEAPVTPKIKVKLSEDEEVELSAEEIREGYLRHGDYTRKTMALADQRRQIEALEAQYSELGKASQAEIGMMAEAKAIERQLAQFQQIDWAGAADADPAAAQKGFMLYTSLRDKHAALQGQLIQAGQHRKSQEAQIAETKRATSMAVLEKAIPNLRDEVPTILEHGQRLGMSKEFLLTVTEPGVLIAIYNDARRLAKVAKPPVAAGKQVGQQAVRTGAAGAPTAASGLSEKVPMDQWAKNFRKMMRG